MLTKATELQDKDFLGFVQDFHLVNYPRIVRAPGLESEAPDASWLTAVGPDILHLLNIVKSGEALVPSKVFAPLMEICLLGIHQCTIYRHKQLGRILNTGFRPEVS